jgi:hypothetical protein
MREIHVIGAGGGASYLMPVLSRMVGSSTIYIWDGDTLENRNLDRQLFRPDQVGENKAMALSDLYNAIPYAEYFFEGSEIGTGSILFGCADNHTARRNILRRCDETESMAIICGNEKVDADAYVYVTDFRDTPNDPRVFAPEILTDNTEDPRRPDGCTGPAQVAAPQLAMANSTAADFAIRLWWFWEKERRALDAGTRPFWPVMHRASATRVNTILLGDRIKS